MICLQKENWNLLKNDKMYYVYILNIVLPFVGTYQAGPRGKDQKLSKIDKFQKSSLFTHMWKKTKCIVKL